MCDWRWSSSLFWLTNSIGRFQLRIEGILSERDIVRVLGERPLLITITAPIFRPARRFGSDGLWNRELHVPSLSSP